MFIICVWINRLHNMYYSGLNIRLFETYKRHDSDICIKSIYSLCLLIVWVVHSVLVMKKTNIYLSPLHIWHSEEVRRDEYSGEQRRVALVIFSVAAIKVVVQAKVMLTSTHTSASSLLVCVGEQEAAFSSLCPISRLKCTVRDACVKNELNCILLCFS